MTLLLVDFRLEFSSVLSILLSAFTSLLAVHWAYFKILKIAKDKNLVDNPDARKLQATPVPVLGGIAVFIGVVAGLLMGAAMHSIVDDATTTRLLPALCSMVVMLYVGAMDDIVGLSPLSRFVVEILTILGMIYSTKGCIDSFHNMFGIESFSWFVGVPLTVFAGVGIINSINMIDGVNGLSSGLCLTCSAIFGMAFVWVGDTPNAILAFSMMASLAPFLLHNVFGKSSRMFIGDAGTMVMGILMTWFVINMLRSDSPLQYYSTTQGVNMIALALAIMSVPIFDTLRVMCMRMMHGKSPFQPDKTHLHHVFIKAGVSHAITALTEIVIDCAIVGVWVLSVAFHCSLELQLLIVILCAVLLVWGTYAFFHYNELNHTPFMHRMSHFSVYTHLGHKVWWLRFQQWLDRREYVEDEEMSRIHREHLERRFMHNDKEQIMEIERQKVYSYIKGKAEVHLIDIKKFSEADPNKIDFIIGQGVSSGIINVIETDENDSPVIIALK